MQGHGMNRLGHGLLVMVLLGLPAAGGAAEPVTPKLTPKLDRLLRQEMAAVEEAMQAIFAAMIRG
ncbi:hypothetical protein [Thiohalorhabdus sp.]|uniref:hypothetical protein n=1 Tax=Thiohalorhabdus sp. TaxID=3094134 RepID=UPI002FC2A129